MFNDVAITTLPNGCRVATAVLPQVESVSVGIWTSVGGRHERSLESGHSHFLEHMLFKGTARRSARKISQEIEGRGGYLNAFTQQETTCYYARVPAEWTSLALDVLADMVCAPRLDPGDVEKEREVILEEISMYRDQPDAHVFDLASEALWSRHSLGRPLIGTPRSLAKVTGETLEAFRRKHYTAGGTVFVAAGKIDHDAFVERVRPYAEQLPTGVVPGYAPVTGATGQAALVSESREIEQAHLVVGFRCFGRHDPRRHTLRMLNVMLGENMSSRLFQVLRERHGLAYSVASSVQMHSDSGALLIGAGLDPARGRKAATLCVDELKRLCERAPGRSEFIRGRDYVLGQLRLGLETSESQMNWLGETLTGYGEFIHPDETVAGCMAVTAEDIQTLAQTLFRSETASVSLIVPKAASSVIGQYREAVDRL